eukprot:1158256-Pelagomonas_calceolata.AAC.8
MLFRCQWVQQHRVPTHAWNLNGYSFAPEAGAKMKLVPSLSTTFCLGTSWRCRLMPGQSLAGNPSKPQHFNPKS